jgi:hypothetical protein
MNSIKNIDVFHKLRIEINKLLKLFLVFSRETVILLCKIKELSFY